MSQDKITRENLATQLSEEFGIAHTIAYQKIDIIFCEMHGESHRKEFKEQYDYWKNKIEPIENKKFFTW